MEKQRLIKNLDYMLLFAVLGLIGIGFLAIYSAAYNFPANVYLNKQMTWAVFGLIIFFIFSMVNYKILVAYSPLFYVLVIVLLVSLFVFGRPRAGAYSWLYIGGFSLQPSEFAKITLILILAKYLTWDNESRRSFAYVVKTFIIASVPLALILKQPDLGTALVFIPIIFAMLYVAGTRVKYLVLLIIAGLVLVPALFMILKDYQKARLLVFINPDIDPLGAGYNIIQSKIAIGSGGFLGKGLLKGTQNRLNFLPERHTDFIFSVIGEEFGLVGGTLVLLLFAAVILSCFKAASQARDLQGRLVVIGIIMYLSTHIIVNVGMAIGIMPITGLPLPLVSYGGSSMFAVMIALGIVESVHARRFMF